MLDPRQIAAIQKRARKGAKHTGRPYEDILAELTAQTEGRIAGEEFLAREKYEEWKERERNDPRRGRVRAALSRILAVAAVAAGAHRPLP